MYEHDRKIDVFPPHFDIYFFITYPLISGGVDSGTRQRRPLPDLAVRQSTADGPVLPQRRYLLRQDYSRQVVNCRGYYFQAICMNIVQF